MAFSALRGREQSAGLRYFWRGTESICTSFVVITLLHIYIYMHTGLETAVDSSVMYKVFLAFYSLYSTQPLLALEIFAGLLPISAS